MEQSLAVWHLSNKKNYNEKKLSEERLYKLLEINYPFDKLQNKWYQNYYELKDWLKSHNGEFPKQGINKLFPNYKSNKKLNMWCRGQKRNYDKLKEKEKQLLDEINFIKNIGEDDIWERTFLKFKRIY